MFVALPPTQTFWPFSPKQLSYIDFVFYPFYCVVLIKRCIAVSNNVAKLHSIDFELSKNKTLIVPLHATEKKMNCFETKSFPQYVLTTLSRLHQNPPTPTRFVLGPAVPAISQSQCLVSLHLIWLAFTWFKMQKPSSTLNLSRTAVTRWGSLIPDAVWLRVTLTSKSCHPLHLTHACINKQERTEQPTLSGFLKCSCWMLKFILLN